MNNSLRKGFIIVQIDGLSYKVLCKAIREERAPFLKMLLNKNKYKLKKMYCGLPAATAHFQLALLYGDNRNIPGQNWFDKEKSDLISVYDNQDVEFLENIRSKGILENGSSICSLFSGGAKSTFWVMSTLDLVKLAQSIKDGSYFRKNKSLHLKIIPFTLIFLLLVPFTYFQSVYKKSSARAARELGIKAFLFGNLIRIYSRTAILNEVKEERQFIYVNCLGYDSVAHAFGRESFNAQWVLKRIDCDIKKIYKKAKKSESVDYDLFILSDHGQVDSKSFEEDSDETIKDFLKSILKSTSINTNERKFKEPDVIEPNDIKYRLVYKYLTRIKPYVEKKSGKKFMNWVKKRWIGKKIIAKLKEKQDIFNQKLQKLKDNIVIVPQGDLLHVYFNNLGKGKIFYEDFKKYYPGILESLKNNKGIGTIALLSKNEIKILDKKGEILVNGGERIISGEPLLGIYDQDFVIRSISELIKMKNSGDIILFGSKVGEKTISFEGGYEGIHGGIEMYEQEMFILTPSSFVKSFEDINKPEDLYPLFRSYHS